MDAVGDAVEDAPLLFFLRAPKPLFLASRPATPCATFLTASINSRVLDAETPRASAVSHAVANRPRVYRVRHVAYYNAAGRGSRVSKIAKGRAAPVVVAERWASSKIVRIAVLNNEKPVKQALFTYCVQDFKNQIPEPIRGLEYSLAAFCP